MQKNTFNLHKKSHNDFKWKPPFTQSWLMWLSPPPEVAGKRQQSHGRVPLAQRMQYGAPQIWEVTAGGLLVWMPFQNWAPGSPGHCPVVKHSYCSHFSQFTKRALCHLHEDFSPWRDLINFSRVKEAVKIAKAALQQPTLLHVPKSAISVHTYDVF